MRGVTILVRAEARSNDGINRTARKRTRVASPQGTVCRKCGSLNIVAPTGASASLVPSGNLPWTATLPDFSSFFRRVKLKHMKNKNKGKENVSGPLRKKRGKRDSVTKLPKMEMYAVLGLELSKRILEKLEEVDKSVEILARQKKRELDSQGPQSETTQ
jgi:hypothetical protein